MSTPSLQHKYAFTKTELLERQAWAGCLQRACVEVGDEELVLSMGNYHSPLRLVLGDFGMEYRTITGSKPRALPPTSRIYLPLFESRCAATWMAT